MPGAPSIVGARTFGRALLHVTWDEHLARTWASTIGAVAPRANHPGAAAVSVIERPALGGLASSGRTPHLRRTVTALAAIIAFAAATASAPTTTSALAAAFASFADFTIFA